MRNRLVRITLLFVLFSFLLPSSVFAQATQTVTTKPVAVGAGTSSNSTGIAVPPSDIAYPYPNPTKEPNFLGQQHNYSVVFRGNGEAVVTAKITFTNLEKTPLKEFQLQFPKVNPQDVVVYQVIKEPTCIRYGSQTPLSPNSSIKPVLNTNCLEYQEPDYFNYYYGNSTYQKADNDLKGEMLTIKLPTAVKENGSGAFFVYYRAFGYAHKDLVGSYPYEFETLKVTDKIRTLQIGISTDSDLYLKDATGTVNYRATDAETTLKSAGAAPMGAPIQNPTFDNFYNQIGQGSLTKNTSNLAPSESYKVKGVFADSKIKLYSTEITRGAAIVLGVIIFLIIVTLFFVKVLRSKKITLSNNRMLLILGSSFAGAVLSGLYTAILVAIMTVVGNVVNYGNYSFSMMVPVIYIFMAIISLGFYGALLFGPAFIVGTKHGMVAGITTFLLTMFWLAIVVVVVIGVGLLTSNRATPIIYPMMRGGIE